MGHLLPVNVPEVLERQSHAARTSARCVLLEGMFIITLFS